MSLHRNGHATHIERRQDL